MEYKVGENRVIICDDIRNELPQYLSGYKSSNIFILTDENTFQFCKPIFDDITELKDSRYITIPAGDDKKNLETLSKVWEFLSFNGADRKSLIINLGGGVVTDLGGFAAAAFKRGIDFINVPTTLLSIVDAAVGGKNGVNFHSLKNEIGVIKAAKAVIVDNCFLKTLDKENFLSGFAEMIKHALISDKKEWLEILEYDLQKRNLDELKELVARSILVKARIIEVDPFEKGVRKALNLGHTIGHAFESYLNNVGRPVLHGYAVAMGMIAETYLSRKLYGFPKETFYELINLVNNYYEPLKITCDDYDEAFEFMKHDKKNEDGNINFSLLEDIGKLKLDTICSKEEIFEALDFYRETVGLA